MSPPKLAVRGCTESLYTEALLEHLPIKVNAVRLGGGATHIDAVAVGRLFITNPDLPRSARGHW